MPVPATADDIDSDRVDADVMSGHVQARTPRRVDRAAAGLRAVRAAGLADLVRTATSEATGALTSDRVLPVRPELRPLLPGGGLRRGATIVAIPTTAAATSLVLAMVAAASAAGSWCGVVGVPTLSAIAAAEQGVALDRLALVPNPGVEWATAVAALLDGLDVVVAAPPGPIAASVAARLAARARLRGSVLVPYGSWRGADLTIETVRGTWHGLGQGGGRLRWRELTLRAWGRGAASIPREVNVWFPGPLPDGVGVVGDRADGVGVVEDRADGVGVVGDRADGARVVGERAGSPMRRVG